MAKVSALTSHQQGYTQTALVQGGEGRQFMVLAEQGIMSASLAFSCLVAPEAGDKVLLNHTGKENHILAILSRPTVNDMTLSFPGSVTLESKSGQVSVTASEGVKVASAKDLQLTSARLSLTAIEANVHATNLNVSGDKVVSHWREVKSVSNALHMVVDSVTQKFKNSFRMVEGVDQQTSTNFLQTIKKTLSIRSHHAVITARKDIKIDGERIHMG